MHYYIYQFPMYLSQQEYYSYFAYEDKTGLLWEKARASLIEDEVPCEHLAKFNDTTQLIHGWLQMLEWVLLRHAQISRTTPNKVQGTINSDCFKPWSFGVNCYMALLWQQSTDQNNKTKKQKKQKKVNNSKFPTHQASALTLADQGESGGSAACYPAFNKVRDLKGQAI